MEHIVRVTTEVEIQNEQEVIDLIKRCANAVLSHQNIDFDSFVDVTIVDDENIRQLNSEYRNKDAVTDVLSFPMYEFENGNPLEVLEKDPETGKIMLGDMILNYNRAKEQANEYGHSVSRECGFLTVHSVLHLLGFDHEREDEDRILMRKNEEEILNSLGLVR